MAPAKRLLLVHAHPDDESINNGATMAAYVAAGAGVTLVTCTRGEEGEVLVPALSHLASHERDELGTHREVELANAMAELGVRDHRFLGAPAKRWRDSGMVGTPPNERPDNFWKADFDEVVGELVAVIEEIRPQVVITYDEFGGYGHPDHVQAHRITMAAVSLARWKVSKVYWNVMPRSVLKVAMDAMKEQGSDFFGTEDIEDVPFAKSDELVTAVVNGEAYVDAKMNALKAHETQITVDGPFFALSNMLGQGVFGKEYYQLVLGVTAEPFDENGRETELFSGVSLD